MDETHAGSPLQGQTLALTSGQVSHCASTTDSRSVQQGALHVAAVLRLSFLALGTEGPAKAVADVSDHRLTISPYELVRSSPSYSAGLSWPSKRCWPSDRCWQLPLREHCLWFCSVCFQVYQGSTIAPHHALRIAVVAYGSRVSSLGGKRKFAASAREAGCRT